MWFGMNGGRRPIHGNKGTYVMTQRSTRAVVFLALLTVLPAARGQGGGAPIPLNEADGDRRLAVLREGLASADFWPAMHAAEGLSADGRGAEVLEALAPRLAAETDPQRRCGLARELVRAGDLSQTRVLLDVLASDDPSGHAHACESLYKVNQIGDGALLRKAMEMTDGEASIKTVMAAAALMRWGNPAAATHVRASLNRDDEAVARTAAWVLAKLGDSRDIPALQAAAKRFGASPGRYYFTHALAALGDAESRAALIRNLGDDQPTVRIQAAEFAADADLSDQESDSLVPMLLDPNLDARVRAAGALMELGQPQTGIEVDNDNEGAFAIKVLVGDAGEFAADVFPATEANPRYSEGSVIVLRDGRLLYATTEFSGSSSDFAKAQIVAIESSDDGRIWSRRRVLQENIGQTNVMSVTLRRLRPDAMFDGPIGFFYLVKNSPTNLHVYLRISNNEGATFGEPIQVTSPPGYHVLNNDRVTVLSTGRIVVPVATSANGAQNDHYTSACLLSDDQGKTWRRSKTAVDYGKRGAMEPEVIELKDGHLLMHIRTQLGHIAFSESTDGGETWTEAKSWGVAAPEAPSTLRRIPSTGDLLLIWNNSVQEGEGHGGLRTPLAAAVSSDEGKTWSKPILLESNLQQTYAYTSLIFHHGRALLTYYVAPPTWNPLSSRFRSVPIGRFYEK